SAVAHQKILVSRDFYILSYRVADVGVDVILRGSRRIVSGSFLAVDGSPRESRAAVVELLRPRPRLVEAIVPILQNVPCDAGFLINQERQNIDFSIPEVVPLVRAAGQPPRGDAVPFASGAGLQKLKEIP